ncbi:hypothetical protein K3729_00715 [Rhodobacteraceae bacterium S2214]|nr:hypothetical protein K3729_00715 [Rhodobacteraceae bacterium S2214]
MIITALGTLAACQRPLPAQGFVQTDGIVPLTVEQSLPDDVSAFSVLQRDGCYYYPSFDRLILIETTAAPDAAVQCNA